MTRGVENEFARGVIECKPEEIKSRRRPKLRLSFRVVGDLRKLGVSGWS